MKTFLSHTHKFKKNKKKRGGGQYSSSILSLYGSFRGSVICLDLLHTSISRGLQLVHNLAALSW